MRGVAAHGNPQVSGTGGDGSCPIAPPCGPTSAVPSSSPADSNSANIASASASAREGDSAHAHRVSPRAELSTLAAPDAADLATLSLASPPVVDAPLTVRPHSRTPSAAGLQIRTDVTSTSHPHGRSQVATEYRLISPPPAIVADQMADDCPQDETSPTSTSTAPLSQSGGVLRSVLSIGSLNGLNSPFSPGSALSSPALAALKDLTPLPSPLIGSEGSHGLVRRASTARPESRDSASHEPTPFFLGLGRSGSQHRSGTLSASSSVKRKKNPYSSLASSAREDLSLPSYTEPSHPRTRSISEYQSDGLRNERPRNVTISGAPAGSDRGAGEDASARAQPPGLHREAYLAEQRGLTTKGPILTTSKLPTPPSSTRGQVESDDDDETKAIHGTYHTIRHPHGKVKIYRPIRQLGQGTFSRVILATSERLSVSSDHGASNGAEFVDVDETKLKPSKLVAIKIVDHGPAGGADAERIELGLKRELEIMREISHASLIRLRAADETGEGSTRKTLLVLNYCPGGDLFELASQRRDEVLTEPMVRRIFAELVGAVRYLHGLRIVHRDIKLESTSDFFSLLDEDRCPGIRWWSTMPVMYVLTCDRRARKRAPRLSRATLPIRCDGPIVSPSAGDADRPGSQPTHPRAARIASARDTLRQRRLCGARAASRATVRWPRRR